ncbi:MAG: septum formation family protein [Actinomycetota bacterium]
MPGRTTFLIVAAALVLSACIPTNPKDAATTTPLGGDTSTTVVIDQGTDLEPPRTGDPNDVAEAAIWEAGAFRVTDGLERFDEDALTSVEQWLPTDLVDGLIWDVFSRTDGPNVLAVSVIPQLTWRADPNFVPALIASISERDAEEVEDGIFTTRTASGLDLFLWSTGDGFVVSVSRTDDAAIAYLSALATETTPQAVWDTGACLYVDPEAESLPYAPFPPDIVVPCEGPHNTEVLVARQIGTTLEEFDDQEIFHERNFECDKAYTEAFGAQKDHTPTLITYMPDADEWDRGDRYLACVVQIETPDGLALTAGPMADRDDLRWDPEPGECFDLSVSSYSVDCGQVHSYQYIGDADVTFEEWPPEGSTAFDGVCDDLRDDFAQPGPAPVEVFAMDLYPYAFDQGDRTVRCMAFVLDAGLLAQIIGSLDDVWRIIPTGGVAA